MTNPLTDQERAAFCPERTRNRTLDYFFVFDGAPLPFIYRDQRVPVDLTALERRNKTVTETLWLEAYHQYLVANIAYFYFYRGPVLQMVFQVHQIGAGIFTPAPAESRPFLPTAEAVRAAFDAWMAKTGWPLADELRRQPPAASWASLLNAPDRTVRIASLLPVGNQVLTECITTWTEEGCLKETAWVAVLIYDEDGTVIQDRSYIDLANWPSARRPEQPKTASPQNAAPIAGRGVMEQFYAYHRSRQMSVPLGDPEKRNLSIVAGEWLEAWNAGRDAKSVHPERFRLQMPVQKFSCNLALAKNIEGLVRETAPDRTMRLALTYAKGNQVAAEGIVSWTDNGVVRESPFIAFFLLDQDGRIVRERRYITLGNWPGAERINHDPTFGLGFQT